MIFEPLHQSNLKGEFYGAMCHWHLCTRGQRKGQVTIREIIVECGEQGRGRGREMVDRLKQVPGATNLFAKCPIDLPANGFYESLGFVCEGQETTSSGRVLNLWRLILNPHLS